MPYLLPCGLKSALLLAFFILLPILAVAEGETGPSGSGRMRGNMCPNQASNQTEAIMVYSPFKPYWKFDKLNGSVQNCWIATDCLFEVAGESRKQQFAATALVMGLIPMTIKDIAWPERRLIFVTERLHWAIELLVLALGLVPIETNKQRTTRDKGCEGTIIAKSGWAMRKHAVKFWIFICAIALMVCYASLTAMEIYSKRSALGCPVPIFIVVWHIVALAPAAIHSLFAKLRRQRYQRKKLLRQASLQPCTAPNNRLPNEMSEFSPSGCSRKLQRSLHLDGNDENDENDEGKDREKKIASAVQGADLDWPVQMAWGVYYIAGTLVFTSIMAVTVPELVVWVTLGLTTAACSKILAFFLCLSFEKTGAKYTNRLEIGSPSQEADS